MSERAVEDEGFDVKLSQAYHDGVLDRLTVLPELCDHQKVRGQPVSEVGFVHRYEELQDVALTWNIRYSARCNSGVDDEHLVQCIDKRALRLFQAWVKSDQGRLSP